MKYCRIVMALSWMAAAGGAGGAAEEQQALTLAEVSPLYPATITATGRVQAVVSVRISARVSGHVAEFGKDAAGNMLDAGMTVKAGDVLFQIKATTFRNAAALSEATLESARAHLANLVARTREERLEQLRQALAELDARLADREREERRFRRLVEVEKTLPAKRLEEVQTELAILRTQRKAAEARLQEAQNGPTPTEVAVAQARVREAEAALRIAQDDLRDATVRAPFDALITRRLKGPGDYLTNMPPTEVLELVSPDKLEAEVRLGEAYFNAVQAGRTMVVLRSALLKGDLRAPVGRVVGIVDAAKGTFEIRLPIPPERREGLVPGAFVTAEVALDGRTRGVIVPIRAVVQQDAQTVVFIAENGKMVRRTVEIGDKLTEGIVVKSGLAGGQKVVVGPADALRDGAPLPDYLKGAKKE